ncbi:MAG: 5'/3'-nucleotidase SurE [Rhodospirillales bacterium]|nr:5'/3'-nucleotidase SurE [Rhodospirillales bacterium]
MRILVTNDDGIDASGLACLETVARELSDDVVVVAPATEQSAKGHAITLRNPLRLRSLCDDRYSVDGTPADCVMMGVRHVMVETGADLVLSGVNRGGNMADDVTYSGTIAAAMEGTLLGVPSIALSLEYRRDEPMHWDTPRLHGADIVQRLLDAGWPRGVLMNVNFPPVPPGDVEGVSVVRQGEHNFADLRPERRTDPFGCDYFWTSGWGMDAGHMADGTDLDAVLKGRIAVTPIALDMTHDRTLKRLADRFR